MRHIFLFITFIIPALIFAQKTDRRINNNMKVDTLKFQDGTEIFSNPEKMDTSISYFVSPIPSANDTLVSYEINSAGKYLITATIYPSTFEATFLAETKAYFLININNYEISRQVGIDVPEMTTASKWLPCVTFSYTIACPANSKIIINGHVGVSPSEGTLRTDIDLTITEL